MAGIEGRPRLIGVFRDIPSERHSAGYGAHGVLRVSHCALSGMVGVLPEHGGMLWPSAAKLVQDSVIRARKVAGTARPWHWGSEKANGKGEMRIELGATVHFVRVRLLRPLLQKKREPSLRAIKWGAALRWMYVGIVGSPYCHGQRCMDTRPFQWP